MSKKQILALTTIFAVVILAVAFAYSPIQLSSISSISNFYLHTRGDEVGGELKSGVWHVEGTTDYIDIQMITVSDATAHQHATGDSYPSDVQITGSIDVEVTQDKETPPYWKIPFMHESDVIVYPKITGLWNGQKAGQTVSPKTVSIWKSVLSGKEYHVPFTISMIKSLGANTGALTTNYPGAVHIGDGKYQIDVSFSQIASGLMEKEVVFYNPKDQSERATVTLKFTVGGLEYDWIHDLVVITDLNGGYITSNNVFRFSDLTQIKEFLDYARGNSKSFYHYWFGGGAFPATGHTTGSFATTAGAKTGIFGTWNDDGTIKPQFSAPIWTGTTYLNLPFFVDEGYIYGTNTPTGVFDFAGWYTPIPGSLEGNSPPGWETHRLPVEAPTFEDKTTSQPPEESKSVVNYLQATSAHGQSKSYIYKFNTDYWGAGAGGAVGVGTSGLGVATPSTARQWSFSLDVSTDLVDTVIVNNDIINVQILSITKDRSDIYANTEATVTATLKNMNNYGSTVTHGFDLPPTVEGTCQITGGGQLAFDANEQKTVTLRIKNLGNLNQRIDNILFNYRITNTAGTRTDEETLSFNFLAGIGQQDTQLTVTCLTQEHLTPINGLNVQVAYGAVGNDIQTVGTQDGVASFNLGSYGGAVTLRVTDPLERYESRTEFFNVNQFQSNSKILHFTTASNDDGNWWENMYLWIALAGVATAITLIVGIIYYKRK